MKIIVLFLVFFSSCAFRNNQVHHDETMHELPYIISLEKEIDNMQQIGLSEVGKNTITYIPLETNTISLLGDILRVRFSESHITVYDRFRQILLFNASGHYIRRISGLGRGPGEFTLVSPDMCFSPDGQRIFVMADGRRCFEFDLDNRLLNTYRLDFSYNQMLVSNDSTIIFLFPSLPNVDIPYETDQSLFIYDLKNNLRKSYPNYYQQNNRQVTLTRWQTFYSYQENIRYRNFCVDTLYTVTEQELIPYAIITFGEKMVPVDYEVPSPVGANSQRIARERFPNRYYHNLDMEDVDNIYISLLSVQGEYSWAIFNKSSNAVRVTGSHFQNDIDGGLPFFPRYIYNDSVLVDWVQPFDLREHVFNSNATEMRRKYGEKWGKLERLANSLDDESNPVLIMVKK